MFLGNFLVTTASHRKQHNSANLKPTFMKMLSLPTSCLHAKKTVQIALAGVALVAGTVFSAYGQGQVASGTVSGSGSGPYTYSLMFSDATGATSSIGSIWYAWVPGFFYLPGTPTSASAPVGWTATVDGHSVQYVATSSAYDIAPGQSLSGFGYQATFSPAQLGAAPNSGESVAYSGGLFSDAGNTFNVTMVPEPSTACLLALGAATVCFKIRRRAV